MAISPEQQDEWRDFERLFGESGWHRLMRKIDGRIAAIKANSLYTVKDEKGLWQHRGWVDILEEFARLEDSMRTQYEALEKGEAPAETPSHPYEQ